MLLFIFIRSVIAFLIQIVVVYINIYHRDHKNKFLERFLYFIRDHEVYIEFLFFWVLITKAFKQ